MLKRYAIRLFVFLFVIVTTGCVNHGPIAIDGRITNINDLATRMTYRYNGGVTSVKNAALKSRWHGEYGSFAMTLFNVSASVGDIPEMVETFRDYCWYRGGVQRDVGISTANPKSFSIACEPDQPGYATDPAYFLFFVNVVLSPNTRTNAKERVKTYSGGYPREYSGNRVSGNAHGYTSGYATSYRDAYRDAYRNSYKQAYRNIYKSEARRNALAKARASTYSQGYCVNFLASENLTHNTAFSDMHNYKNYRKRFEAVLEKYKAIC